jgi:hypothetical protein
MEIKNSKTKIAFLISIFPVISETFILNEMTGAIGNGFEISQKRYLRKGYYDVLFREGDLFLAVCRTQTYSYSPV